MAKKIMVIDDSSAVRKLVTFTVTLSGYRAAEASNGREALDMLNLERPDLIICDINMPVLDGISFLKALKGDSAYFPHRFTPVLLLTTESEGTIIEEGRKLGARAWLQKPFDQIKLNEAVQMLIG